MQDFLIDSIILLSKIKYRILFYNHSGTIFNPCWQVVTFKEKELTCILVFWKNRRERKKTFRSFNLVRLALSRKWKRDFRSLSKIIKLLAKFLFFKQNNKKMGLKVQRMQRWWHLNLNNLPRNFKVGILKKEVVMGPIQKVLKINANRSQIIKDYVRQQTALSVYSKSV